MLVLHGFWSMSGSLQLWAEDSDLLVKSPSQALRSARPHPFAAAADTIAAIHPGKPGTSVLLLPSLRSAPLDSPELIRITPRPAARSDATLLAWTVPVMQLDAAAAFAAIDEPDGHHLVPRGEPEQRALPARLADEVRHDDHKRTPAHRTKSWWLRQSWEI